MARPLKLRDANRLRPRPRDLFGQVVITHSDLEAWVRAIAPHLAHADWRIHNYIKDYRVAEKVRVAKLERRFDEVIDRGKPRVDRCESCGHSHE